MIVHTTPLTPTERTTLSRAEANIKEGLNTFLHIGEQLLIIKEGQLFRENYASFDEYMYQRWGIKKSAGYNYIAGFKLAENIEEHASDVDISNLKVSHSNQLAGYDPQSQVEIYTNATVLAKQDDTEVTSKHIKQAIATHDDQILKRQVYQSNFAPIIQDMNRQLISPQKALQLCDTLKLVKPAVRGQVLLHQIRDPELIRLMNEKSHTETYKQAVESGHLSVWYDDLKEYYELPLTRCSARHFRACLDEAYQEHRRQKAISNNMEKGIRTVSCLIHLGDGKKTVESLLGAGASTTDLRDLLQAAGKYLSDIRYP